MPGSQWLYSGEGYSFLQLVVAHLTGRVDLATCETLFDGVRVCATEIDAYLKTNLLRPFGMSSSGYVWDVPSANTDSDDRPSMAGCHSTPARPKLSSGVNSPPARKAKSSFA